MSIRENHSLSHEGIDTGRWNLTSLGIKTLNIAIAEVVAKYDNNVGSCCLSDVTYQSRDDHCHQGGNRILSHFRVRQLLFEKEIMVVSRLRIGRLFMSL